MKVCCLIGCPPGDPCLQAWGAMESRPRREAVLSERPNLARLQAAWCTPGCNVPSRLRYRLRQLLGLPSASAWPEEEQTREVSTRSFSRYRCCLVAGCPTTTPASQKRTLRSPFRKPLALAIGFLTLCYGTQGARRLVAIARPRGREFLRPTQHTITYLLVACAILPYATTN